MQLLFDLHTHTTYSHGKGTVLDNARAGAAKGLITGISDHGAGHRFYGVQPRDVPSMRADIASAEATLDCGAAVLGLEANLIGDGGKTDVELSLGAEQTDYVLLGLHKGAGMAYTLPLMAQSRVSPHIAMERLTDSLIAALWDTRIAAITHPGLYVPVDMRRLCQACAVMGVALELSCRHPMSAENAKLALDGGALFIISTDAHTPDAIGVFDNALHLAETAGIPDERIINSSGFRGDGSARIEGITALWNKLALNSGTAGPVSGGKQ